MPTSPSTYMNLPVPVPTQDPGPEYAFNLNSCLTTIDSHTHAPGQGQQITPAGINITTDLSFGGNNGTNYRSIRFTSQSGTIALGSDIGCLYVASTDLYYNDTSGNQIRLTQNGAVAGTPGSIANLLFPASVTYVTGTQTFVFQSSTATAGNIDAGSIKIREVVANANAVTLSSPTSLASNYTLTLPTALPTSAFSRLVSDVSGNLSFRNVTGPTINILTSTTGNYSTPSNTNYLRVRMVGGGGGGSGGGGTPGGGGGGGITKFGTLLAAYPGDGGSGTPPGAGGVTSTSGITAFAVSGGFGCGAANVANSPGGAGGNNPFGGAGGPGAGGATNDGSPAKPFTGGGGAGGSTNGASATPGGGGGAGGYIEAYIYNPQSSYGYVVGTSGTGGTAGTNGGNGGAGGVGVIIVEAYPK